VEVKTRRSMLNIRRSMWGEGGSETMKSETWLKLVNELRHCRICHKEAPPFIDPKSFPLFMKNPPQSTDILFILEAPNRDDTYNSQKGYLTIGPDTDESGKFFFKLFTEELQFDLSHLFVTNSVLCLPKHKGGKYPVSMHQKRNCIPHLKRQIEELDPMVVCTLGKEALLTISLIENHSLNIRKLREVAGQERNWYGRILFPLYHTGKQVRHGPTGRDERLQRKDWQKLRELWRRLKEM